MNRSSCRIKYKGYELVQYYDCLTSYYLLKDDLIVQFGETTHLLSYKEGKAIIDRYIKDGIKYILFKKPLKFIKKLFRRK